MEDQNKYFWRGGELEDIKQHIKLLKELWKLKKRNK